MAEANPIPTYHGFKNLIGHPPFGRLKVIAFADLGGRRKMPRWLCECDCSNRVIVTAEHLRDGITRSCGCLRKDIQKSIKVTHGKSGSRVYEAWLGMRRRCNNPSDQAFHHYGGRGIRICERWKSFANFYADMGDPPTQKHSIDRFPDNNGNYEPGNCRWATQKQQMANQRRNHKITWNRKTRIVREWEDYLGFPSGLLSSRLSRGWSESRALGTRAMNPEEAADKQSGHSITWNGETHGISAWARIMGIHHHVLRKRIQAGWSIDRSFTTAIDRKKTPYSKKFRDRAEPAQKAETA